MNKQIKYHTHSFKINGEMEKDIEAYCAKHRLESQSEFFRFAISQVLRPDIEDPELVFSSLQQLHNKMNTIERQQEILFSFICFLARHFLIYHAEIPNEMKDAAVASGIQRYNKMFKAFQESLKHSPSMFESLLADYFERT